jgi:hypothetical protein
MLGRYYNEDQRPLFYNKSETVRLYNEGQRSHFPSLSLSVCLSLSLSLSLSIYIYIYSKQEQRNLYIIIRVGSSI